MTDAAAPPTAEAEPHWLRLHPATLALSIAKLGPRSLNFLPAIAALGVTGNWAYIVPAFLLFLLFSLLAAWLHWLRFRFAVGADEVVIESGVLARQHRTIPFDRIQDVSIEQGLIARVLGIAKVEFETGAGGGKDHDASLDAVGLDAAEALRGVIRAHRSELATALAPADAPGAEDRLLFAMGPRRLLIAGLFNFSLAALAVFGAAMQFFDNLLPFDFNIFNPVDWIDVAEAYGLDAWLVAHRWVAGLGAAISLLFIGFAGGVATMFFTNWGFRLQTAIAGCQHAHHLTGPQMAIMVGEDAGAIGATEWVGARGFDQSVGLDTGKPTRFARCFADRHLSPFRDGDVGHASASCSSSMVGAPISRSYAFS